MRKVFWGHTLEDLKVKVKLRLGYEHSKAVQEFCHLMKVVSLAFGGGEEQKQVAPANFAVAQASLAAVLGG